jgi:NitT/TauT family transport system substrate-binding protein
MFGKKVFILMCMFCLILAGCGSKTATQSENNIPKAGTVSPSQTNSNKALQKVTIVIGTADINTGYPFATLPLAMGWFKEEGLDVKLVPGKASTGAAQILISGQADLGILSPSTAILAAVNEHASIKSVYAISRRNGNIFTVMNNSPIKNIADLKGKTIGFPDIASAQVPFAHARYKESGVPLDSVKEISLGYGTQAFEALKKGTVDAYVTFSSGFGLGQANCYDLRKLPMTEWQNNMYDYNLYVASDKLKANADLIAKVGRAFAKATVFIKTNPEAAVKLFWKQYPERAPQDPNDTKAFKRDLDTLLGQSGDMRVSELPVDFAWGSQDPKVWDFMQNFLFDSGMIKSKLDTSVYYDNSLQDQFMKFDVNAIVKQAKESK